MKLPQKLKRGGLTVMVIAAAFAAAAWLGLAVASFSGVQQTASQTDRIELNNRLAACRDYYGSLVDDAQSQLATTRSALSVLAARLQVAAVTDDNATQQQIILSMPDALHNVTNAVSALNDATSQFQSKLMLSQNDSDAFLASCP